MLRLAVWAKILKLIGGGSVSGVVVEMVGRAMEGVGVVWRMRWWHWLGHPFDNTCRGRVLGQNHKTERRWLGGSVLSTPAKKNGRGDGGGW